MELKTPLYDMHVKYKGKIVPFAGYLLPVQYEKGVIAEHMAVREQCGLFDVSHMGEILLSGPDALKNVNMLLTNDYTVMEDGTARYSPMCNEAGGVVDDLIVYKIKDNSYFMSWNLFLMFCFTMSGFSLTNLKSNMVFLLDFLDIIPSNSGQVFLYC